MKKNSTAKKTARQLAIKQRAQVITDSDSYDDDTRQSIAYQLKTNYQHLADSVRDAEQGVTICDTVMVMEGYRKAAKQVIALFKGPVPDFVTDAVMDAVNRASAIKGVDIWEPSADGSMETFKLKGLTHLFALTRMLSLRDSVTPSNGDQVLRAMHELLHNPETPHGLYEAVAEFSCAQSNFAGDDLYHSDTFLTAILKTVSAEDRMGAIIAARPAREQEAANAEN